MVVSPESSGFRHLSPPHGSVLGVNSSSLEQLFLE